MRTFFAVFLCLCVRVAPVFCEDAEPFRLIKEIVGENGDALVHKIEYNDGSLSMEISGESINITPLKSANKIISLHIYCKDNVKNIVLDESITLKQLSVFGNGLTELPFLRNMPELESLRITGQNIHDLTGVASCRKLSSLHLDGRLIRELGQIGDPPLRHLVLSGCGVENLNGLERLPLEALEIRACVFLKDISAVSGHRLEKLTLMLTPLEKVPNLDMSGIKSLDLFFNANLADFKSFPDIPDWIDEASIVRTPIDGLRALAGKTIARLGLSASGDNLNAVVSLANSIAYDKLSLILTVDKDMNFLLKELLELKNQANVSIELH